MCHRILSCLIFLIFAAGHSVNAQNQSTSKNQSSSKNQPSSSPSSNSIVDSLIDNIPTALQTINGLLDKQSLNKQTVLTNFLQVASTNLTSSANQGLQLQGNLFALNFFKDSAQKYNNAYYLKKGVAWLRNTQLIAGGGLGNNNQLNKFNAGFTVNLLDLRDSSLYIPYYDVVRTITREFIDSVRKIEWRALRNYHTGKPALVKAEVWPFLKSAGDSPRVVFPDNLKAAAFYQEVIGKASNAGKQVTNNQLTTLDSAVISWRSISDTTIRHERMNQFLSAKTVLDTLSDNFASVLYTDKIDDSLHRYWDSVFYTQKIPSWKGSGDFSQLLDTINANVKKDSAYFHTDNLANIFIYYWHVSDSLQRQISRRPLLQAGLHYTYAATGITRTLIPTVEFIRGYSLSSKKNLPVEMDISLADSVYTDTLIGDQNLKRNVGMLKGSFDLTLFTDKSGNSLLEAKLGPEYDHVYNGRYTSERQDKYYAVLDLLGRPTTKSPWFTITIKYDMNKGNFLGFLNLTFALDNSSNSK